MKRISILTALALTLTISLASPVVANEPAEFNIDTAHSSVAFKVDHMVISKTSGKFTEFEGTIKLAEDVSKSSVEVTINTASIDTANEDRDKHLRAPDFFDSENHPTITFKSTRIKEFGDRWLAQGDLTMRGVTKRVVLPFKITGQITDPWGNDRLGVDVEPITLDRQDYGISFSKTMEAGGLVVGDEVTIDIEIEAIKKKEE